MFGMTSAMTYVGVVDMNEVEILELRRAELVAELSKTDTSVSPESAADHMMVYEHLANELIRKNKKALLASDFNEKRGDMVAIVSRAFDPGVKLIYRMGDWERSEPKPVVEDKTA